MYDVARNIADHIPSDREHPRSAPINVIHGSDRVRTLPNKPPIYVEPNQDATRCAARHIGGRNDPEHERLNKSS
jgi:hypothetical protein